MRCNRACKLSEANLAAAWVSDFVLSSGNVGSTQISTTFGSVTALTTNSGASTNMDVQITTTGTPPNSLAIGSVKLEEVKNSEYLAEVLTAQDYYPFGMQLPGHSVSSGDYRYGFNGMEKDDEVKGSGNSYTTLYRQNDPRLGRWMSLDPRASQLPWQSPYNSMDNNPILYNDPLGDWVKGEGFIRNVFNSDNKINAENFADKMGGSASKVDGTWRAGWSETNTVDFGNGAVNLDVFAFKEFNGKGSEGSEFGSAVSHVENNMDNFFKSNPAGFGPESDLMGTKGAKTVAKGLNEAGTNLTLTPFAPIGYIFKGQSILMNTFIDAENPNLTKSEVGLNLAIRGAIFGIGYKFTPRLTNKLSRGISQEGRNQAQERAVDFGINKAGDAAEEWLIGDE